MNFRLLFIAFATFLLLAGCQNTMNDEGRVPTGDRDQTIQPTRFSDDGHRTDRRDRADRMDQTNRMSRERGDNQSTTRDRGDHNRYDVAKEAAEKITSEIDEIDRSYVLTTNNNAYVAVVFDDDTRRGQGNLNDRTNHGNVGNVSDRGQGDENTGDNRTNVNRRGTADNDLSNRTFIGRDDDISDDFKREIANIVRSVDRNIDNVYVSTNPDFVDLTNNYIDDVNAGHPIRGFFDEMGDMIQRVFPQNR